MFMKTYSENTCTRCGKVERRDGVPTNLPIGWKHLYHDEGQIGRDIPTTFLAALCGDCWKALKVFLSPRPYGWEVTVAVPAATSPS